MNDKDVILMCKDTAVYDISNDIVINENLLPGCMRRKTLNYSEWMKSRYSAGTNVTARRLMLRAFGSDNHATSLNVTRALSLSDCYWLKQRAEEVKFEEVTPYLHKEWDGNGIFTGGSIATLFVNGAANKCWLDSKTLLKVNSYKELEPFTLCEALELQQNMSKVDMSDRGILLTNFTSTETFFESMEQSGFVGETDNPMLKAVEIFGEPMVALLVIDYLVEHDDRHFGNYGFLRNSNTGEYIKMAPYFDFDWAWCDNVSYFPNEVLIKYKSYIKSLCIKAKIAAPEFTHSAIIIKRATELLLLLTNLTNKDEIIRNKLKIPSKSKKESIYPVLFNPTEEEKFIIAFQMLEWDHDWETITKRTGLTKVEYDRIKMNLK